jgi:phage terminase Nu1 subunit (DNA packaging protein)
VFFRERLGIAFPKIRHRSDFMTEKRKARGRPRRSELDALEEELAITRRRAAQIAAEGQPTSEIGRARLRKLELEAQRIELQIQELRRQARVAKGELLTLAEAREICARPHQAVAHILATLPRTLAMRLHSLPVREIERTLAQSCDEIMQLLRESI